jgi:hypothetical protein
MRPAAPLPPAAVPVVHKISQLLLPLKAPGLLLKTQETQNGS